MREEQYLHMREEDTHTNRGRVLAHVKRDTCIQRDKRLIYARRRDSHMRRGRDPFPVIQEGGIPNRGTPFSQLPPLN